MTAITLRAYNQEISTLIDRGLTDEASDHCRFILSIFPKVLETYRLLGKAYLESNRYKEAGDTFLRVLAVTPDDYLAHAGMSIIREESSNLSAAIWHMERAFECQPGNAAIQTELKVLYGKRDGTPPEKIRLTRGALCRMYARGNQYRQAIAEVRAVLNTTPDRYDLDVLLAELLAATDQKDECKGICLRILQKYPHCLTCNRLMARFSAPASPETAKYNARLAELDPYQPYVTADNPDSTQVPADKVLLDKLVYFTPAEITAGIGIDHEHFEEAPVPDDALDQDDTQPLLAEDTAADEMNAPEIPDWLEMNPADQASAASIPETESAPDEPTLEAADDDSDIPATIQDIPRWEQELPANSSPAAPPVAKADANAGTPTADFSEPADEEDETPDWLKNLFIADSPAPASPGWSTPTSEDYPPETPDEPTPAVEVPESSEAEEPATPVEEVVNPDWLVEMEDDDTAAPPVQGEPESTASDSTIARGGVSDAPNAAAEMTEPPAAPAKPGDDEFEIPDWLLNIHEGEQTVSAQSETPAEAAQLPASTADLDARIDEITAQQNSGADPQATTSAVEELLQQHPDNSRLWLLAGDLRKAAGDLAGAIEAYTKAQSILKSIK